MEGCIFCGIINKDIPARIVHEDDEVLAFEDINAKAPVHILIIPKEHIGSLNDLPKDREPLLGRILVKARAIAAERGILKNGYRIVLNTGPDSGQEVFHIHVHLLGGRRMTWPPG
jgi:histidine triad (HIT) family protein